MRLEIMRETDAEIEDMFFSLYGAGQDGGHWGFQAQPPSPGSGLIHPGRALARPTHIPLPGLAEVDENESRWTVMDSLLGDYLEGCAYSMEEEDMMGSMDLSVGLSAGLRITLNKSSHIVSEAPHLMTLWDRRRLAQAGNLDTLPRDNSRPQCEFIHCACKVCQFFCTSKGDRKDSQCTKLKGYRCV